jgi:hypothetical protein
VLLRVHLGSVLRVDVSTADEVSEVHSGCFFFEEGSSMYIRNFRNSAHIHTAHKSKIRIDNHREAQIDEC